MSTKYYTSGGVVVTGAQRAAARVMRSRALNELSYAALSPATIQIADAQPRKVSDNVSNGNLVHARELDITAVTTVSELFELIDLPYRVTKHATLSIVPRARFDSFEGTFTLRLEWRGEPE